MKNFRFLLTCTIISFALLSCNSDDDITIVMTPDEEPEVEKVPVLPATAFDYSVEFPSSFQDDPLLSLLSGFVGNNNNPTTDEGATLGRVLFYDKKLSENQTKSCASCHHQENAFTDPLKLSEGFEGALTARNSMPLFNLQYSRRLFWDARVRTIEEQALIPIQDDIEMGMTLDALVERLQKTDYYIPLFEAAFGDTLVTSERIALALGQFTKSIVSHSSKFDEGLLVDFENYTEEELYGKVLFFESGNGCNHCHTTVNFTAFQMMNNGLDSEYADQGQYEFSGNEEDKGVFKVPSLRNIELTGPYMHDGRFNTLEEVLDHYSENVQPHPNLNDRITVEGSTGGTPKQLNLSDEEKSALIAFMRTLTDNSMLTDEKYSDPFQ